MNISERSLRFSVNSLAIVLLMLPASANGATVSFSSLETVLAEPDNKALSMYAAWTSWYTEVFEHNLPFIEIDNSAPGETRTITSFEMTIGDTQFNFSNEFRNKNLTNSSHLPANGSFAVLGGSTPNATFNASIPVRDNPTTTGAVEQLGDTLLIEFNNGGIAPRRGGPVPGRYQPRQSF